MSMLMLLRKFSNLAIAGVTICFNSRGILRFIAPWTRFRIIPDTMSTSGNNIGGKA